MKISTSNLVIIKTWKYIEYTYKNVLKTFLKCPEFQYEKRLNLVCYRKKYDFLHLDVMGTTPMGNYE